ncbi:MAG: DUF1822 family protein [Phormidesmis sp.]
MDWNAAVKWVDTAVFSYTGRSLREPEIVILKGTCRGLTYEQMAHDSDYSTNYLMRDVAPKLWKQLSSVFARSVGKTNFCVALESYAAANPGLEAALTAGLLAESFPEDGRSDRRSNERFGLSAIAKRQEADQGWLSAEGNQPGNRMEASLLSVSTMSPGVMYGYERALQELGQWLIESTGVGGRSHLIGLWGLRGVGKTLLLEQAIAQSGVRFEGIIWRSLQDKPTLNELSTSLLASLGIATDGQATSHLLSLMTSRSLLIVLESAEAILQADSLAGDYVPGCEGYAGFFQSAANSRSCVVLTGIEGPANWVRQGGYGGSKQARSLLLSGLDQPDAIALLEAENLAEPSHWPELTQRYQGHPLSLKLAARVIREMFNGRVEAFLKQSPVLFNGIFQLLSPTFERLSALERDLLYWLAIGDLDLSLAALESTLPISFSAPELISALDSLKQRSLLQVPPQSDPPIFQLPALVKDYTIYRLRRLMSQPEAAKAPADLPVDLLDRRARDRSSSVGYSADRQASIGGVIDLSPTTAKSIQLSQWFQGQFQAHWRSLDRLFESTDKLAMRLRNAYHLRDEGYLKRYKRATLIPVDPSTADLNDLPTEAVLLVAVRLEADNLYQVCVQAQPAVGEAILPEHLSLTLLDAERNALAVIVAQPEDTVIQLPYFRGTLQETFEIKLALWTSVYSETFVI